MPASLVSLGRAMSHGCRPIRVQHLGELGRGGHVLEVATLGVLDPGGVELGLRDAALGARGLIHSSMSLHLQLVGAGHPLQLLEGAAEDCRGMAGGGPDLVVPAQPGVEVGAHRRRVGEGGDPADDLAGVASYEVRLGALQRPDAELGGDLGGVDAVRRRW